MLRRARFLLRKRSSRRHTPAGIAALPTPQWRRTWGDLTGLDAPQKQELLRGSWRQTKAVHLAPDDADRDRGGFAEGHVSFASEEAADDFLAQESADDAAEREVPSLTLAQQFFVDLAVTADEELDVLQDAAPAVEAHGAQLKKTPAEVRQDESDDVQRHFFADYYLDHGLLSPGEDRFAFVDATMTPGSALFEVNCEHPLARLTTRDQLEVHVHGQPAAGAPAVFVSDPAGDPLTYAVARVPTQPYGAPLRLPYTAATSFLALKEAAEGAPSEATPELASAPLSALPDQAAPLSVNEEEAEAEALAAWLRESDEDGSSAALPVVSGTPSTPAVPGAAAATQAPSLAHTQWLQRQVATDALVPVDVLGRILTILAARWAYPAQKSVSHRGARAEPPLILDLFGANARQRTDVYCDVARFLYRLHAQEEETREATCATRREEVPLLPCVAVCVPPVRATSADATRVQSPKTRPRASAGEVPGRPTTSKMADLTAELHPAEQSPFILYVQAAPSNQPHHGNRHKGTTHTRPDRERTARNAFDGVCDVVLCTPLTSEDGRRPRTILGDERQVDEDAHTPAANDFIAVCTRARELFPKLVWQLSLALKRYARPSGGLVMYATYSMNPLENEAVVAAAIRQVHSEGYDVACLSLERHSPLLTACDEDEQEVLLRLLTLGQRGLASWASVEAADARHEAEATPEALRESIARAAWRLRPDKGACDGGFLVALCVNRSPRPRHPGEHAAAFAAASPPGSSAAPYCLQQPPTVSPLAHTAEPVPVHFLTSSCAWWWRRVARDGDESFWVRTLGGVVVGVAHGIGTASGQTADEPVAVPRLLEVSSSLNNHSYGYLMDQQELLQAFTGIDVVSISVPLLYELLRCRSVSSAALLHAVMQGESESDVASLLASLSALMTVQQATPMAVPPLPNGVLATARAHWQHVSLLLAPTMASAAPSATPHEALAQELREVRVAMKLRFRRVQRHRTCEPGPDASLTYPFEFSLAPCVPRTIPGRRLHLEASQEACAGLRDALLYVMRRCGLEARQVPFAYPATFDDTSDANGSDEVDEVSGPRAGGRAGSGAVLADDEFEVDGGSQEGPPAELLSFHEQATRHRRLHRLEGQMRAAGLDDNNPPSWAAGIHYGSARRSGRG